MEVPARLIKLKYNNANNLNSNNVSEYFIDHKWFYPERNKSVKIKIEVAVRYKTHFDKKKNEYVKNRTHEIELLNNQLRVYDLKRGPGYVETFTFKDVNEAHEVFTFITGKTLTEPNTLFESFADHYWFIFGCHDQMPIDVYVRFCKWSMKNNS